MKSKIQPMMHKIACRTILCLAFSFCFMLFSSITVRAEWSTAAGSIYQDPITHDIIFTSVDKEHTSGTFYHTQGFTISDGMKDANGSIVDSGIGGDITIALGGSATQAGEPVDLGRGIIQTTWTISYASIMEQIAATSSEWLNKINSPNGEVYLNFNAVIAVHDPSMGFDPITGKPLYSGYVDMETGEYLADVWDKYNWNELKTLYGWDSSFFKNHYDQALMIAMGLLEDDNNINIDDMTQDDLTNLWYELGNFDPSKGEGIIGKSKPDYCTYNYDPTGQFNLGDGIPSSEKVTNGYNADEWYGTAMVKQRAASHSWTFGGNISYNEWFGTGNYDVDGNEIGYDIRKTEAYSYTVNRAVKYWYLGSASFFDLAKVTDSNEAFTGGSVSFISYIETNITCTINGVDVSSVTSYKFPTVPNDNWHVDWPVLSASDLRLDISAQNYGAATSAFASAAEAKIKQASEIEVRNDELSVNGKTYMHSNMYKYSEFDSGKNETNSYYEIGDDYGNEEDEQTTTIPANTANDKYPTTISADYKKIVVGSQEIMNHTKSPENSSVEDRIKAGYTGNEPIVVHTPTVSPVEVINPETGLKYEVEDMGNQLISGAINADADYQFLLDGTYTMKFIPEAHMEHMGYDQSYLVESIYNKYCEYRQVCFPFTVQLDGIIYEPDDETTAKNGKAKEVGYTEWINVPKGADGKPATEVEFYIPTWATEKSDYVVQFRVAPINVIDQDGVDHIDDVEWLKNAAFMGVPLYEYVSTYSFTVQLSGIIYDFKVNGVNDRDIFQGKEGNNGESYGIGIGNYYPFCPYKEEKRTGTLNRIGTPSVRYTVDGTLTNDWKEQNTLPFSVGRSIYNPAEGTLRKGNSFTFSLRTIANLWDEEGDAIVIKPHFRFISLDGVEQEDIDVYYHTDDAEGKEEELFVKYGSDVDKTMKHYAKIADIRNDGAYYMADGFVTSVTGREIKEESNNHQDDAEYSFTKANAYLYEKNHIAIPTWPEQVYSSANKYLNKEKECYCLTSIVMDSDLRLLTGNVEQLEQNIDNQGDSLTLVKNGSHNISWSSDEFFDEDYWDKHRKSMQTWFGAFWVPNQLFITDDVFEADADGDGSSETYDDLYDYAVAKGSVDENDDIFKKEGYLVVNFSIYSVNNGVEHLVYSAGKTDMWQTEGAPATTTIGDKNLGEDIVIPVKSGDVAIVDLRESVMDRFYVGYNRIN